MRCESGKAYLVGDENLPFATYFGMFFKAAGNPLRVVGLNTVGLERNGVSVEARRALKEAYRHLYRSKLNVSQAVERIRSEHGECEEIQHLLRFIEASDRGIVR